MGLTDNSAVDVRLLRFQRQVKAPAAAALAVHMQLPGETHLLHWVPAQLHVHVLATRL